MPVGMFDDGGSCCCCCSGPSGGGPGRPGWPPFGDGVLRAADDRDRSTDPSGMPELRPNVGSIGLISRLVLWLADMKLYSWSWWLGGVCHVSGDRATDRSLDMWASWGCRGMYEGTCSGFQVEFG